MDPGLEQSRKRPGLRDCVGTRRRHKPGFRQYSRQSGDNTNQSLLCPAAEPAPSKYDLGVYYMPGWTLDSSWDTIRNAPYQMPVLGFFAEGSPQVIDWQIKWAVEHGIKFFAVDWYWWDWAGGRYHTPFSKRTLRPSLGLMCNSAIHMAESTITGIDEFLT